MMDYPIDQVSIAYAQIAFWLAMMGLFCVSYLFYALAFEAMESK